jgi:hypothetical protein
MTMIGDLHGPDRLRRHAITIATVVVMAVTLWTLWSDIGWTAEHWSTAHRPTWVGDPRIRDPKGPNCDLDTWLIHGGLVAAPRFRDTFRWWVGTWAGQVPFYRPLSSLVFWCEWKQFGDYEVRYGLVSILLYLAAAYQFTRLAADLFLRLRHPRPAAATLVAGLLFVHGLFLLVQQPDINSEVYTLWKNQPDSLCALFSFLFLRAYLRMEAGLPQLSPSPGLEGSMPPVARTRSRSVYAALGWYLAACASKEAAVLLPLALPLLDWPPLKLNPSLRRAALIRPLPLLIALPLFLIFRALCLRTLVGFRYGSNGSLSYRFSTDIFSIVSQLAAVGNWAPLVLGFVLLGLMGGVNRRAARYGSFGKLPLWEWLLWIVGALLVLVGFALPQVLRSSYASHSPSDVAVALQVYSVPETAYRGLTVAVFLAAIARALRARPDLALFSYAWALLIFLPTLASPAVMHRFYLMNAGYALLLGVGLTAWNGRPKPETEI